MIRLGVCTGPDKIGQAAELGFDFIECGLAWLSGLSDQEYEEVLARVLAAPIRVEACNGMLPGTLKVVGPQVDETAIRQYLEMNFARAQKLGVKVVVFGSGAARGVPEGYPHEKAWRDIAAYLRIVEEYCEKYAIDLAIEPLRRAECNILNFVSEGAEMAALLNLPHIGVLGDTHHMNCGGEPVSALIHAGSLLRHVHISHSMGDEGGRDYPYEGDGNDHQALFAALRQANYQGRVSIEAGCKDFLTDGARALALLRSAQ